jgi:hypothetical protein
VPEPSAFEFEMIIEKLQRYKSPDIDPAELIRTGGRTIRSEIHKCVNCMWSKEELPQQCKESIIIPITIRMIKQVVVIIKSYHSYQLHTRFDIVIYIMHFIIIQDFTLLFILCILLLSYCLKFSNSMHHILMIFKRLL